MYALPENVKYSYLSDSPSRRGRYYGGRFGYASGPLDVAVAYGQSTAADTLLISETGVVAGTRLAEKLRTINLGASYDFGVLKLMGELSQVKDKAETTTAPSSAGRLTFKDDDEYNGAMIGMTVPVGAGVLKASYARVKFKNGPGFRRADCAGTGPRRVGEQARAGLRPQPVEADRTLCHGGSRSDQERTEQSCDHGRRAWGPCLLVYGFGRGGFGATQRYGLRLRAAPRILTSSVAA